jgi:drug/metabolite transporter (DMT)-like permease
VKEQLYGAPYYFAGALLGSGLICIVALTVGMSLRPLTGQEWGVLAYLGIVSSGLGFAIWNYGVSQVNYGVLAVASDFKLPIAILVSLTIFGEHADLAQLGAGTVILVLAAAVARR